MSVSISPRQDSFERRLKFLNDQCEAALSQDIWMTMSDIYTVFPECRSVRFPDHLQIPPRTLDLGLREFVIKLNPEFEAFATPTYQSA